jgi:hypothetical protein
MEPIHQKYKANESTSRHNPKKKRKQTVREREGEKKKNTRKKSGNYLGHEPNHAQSITFATHATFNFQPHDPK